MDLKTLWSSTKFLNSLKIGTDLFPHLFPHFLPHFNPSFGREAISGRADCHHGLEVLKLLKLICRCLFEGLFCQVSSFSRG